VAQLKRYLRPKITSRMLAYPFLRRSGPIETLIKKQIVINPIYTIHFCEEVAQLKR